MEGLMRCLVSCITLLAWSLLAASTAEARSASIAPPSTAVCTFADGKQISVQYSREPANGRALRTDEVWAPGRSPMILFTETAFLVENSNVPIGAYSMYIIPGERQWTLILNRNVSTNRKYDQRQDLLRTPMQSGSLSVPVSTVQIVFAHLAPKQCNMRLYRANRGVWVSFSEE
jgi:Protein of unknown function (DUF2911)